MLGGTAGPVIDFGKQATWLVFWIVAYGMVAFVLLMATLKTFNRCLGRMDDQSPDEEPFRTARKPKAWPPDAELDFDLDPRHWLADPMASDH